MKAPLTLLIVAALAGFPARAQDDVEQTAAQAEEPPAMLQIFEAGDVSLEEFKWVKRPIVVFADSPNDPRFTEQIELLTDRPGDLLERDVVVITDTDPSADSAIREKLRPRGFQLTIIGKDGAVKLRKPFPWDTREISRSIDKMPIRQREIRERKSGAG